MRVRNVVFAMVCLCLASSAFGQEPNGEMPGGPGMGMGGGPGGQGGYGGPPGPRFDGPGPGPNPQAGLNPYDEIPRSWLQGRWDPKPRWNAHAEVLWLKPNFPNSDPLAMQFQPVDDINYAKTPVSAIGQDQYNIGLRGAFEYYFGTFKSFEWAGFVMSGPKSNQDRLGIHDFPLLLDANAIDPFNPSTTNNNLRRGLLNGIPAGFPQEADFGFVFQDFEALGTDFTFYQHYYPTRGWFSDLAFGVGARYFGMNERTTIRFLDEVNQLTGDLNASVNNDLFGIQIAGRAVIQTPISWFRINSDCKIGLMGNTTGAKTSVVSNGVTTGANNDQESYFSPLVEANFMFEFFLHKHITAYAGYQILYVDRVLRATEQYNNNIGLFVSDQKELGSLFMHGPRFGLEFSY